MKTYYRGLVAALAILLLPACGKKAEAPAEAAPAAAHAAVAAVVPEEALAATPPAHVAAEPVDVCALLGAGEAASVTGPLFKEPGAQPAQGSLLGQCDYMGSKAMLMLSARPSAEYRQTVDYAARQGGSKSVDGLGASAEMTSLGLMIQPEGKPYFLVVYALTGGKFDENAALTAARAVRL